MPAAVPTSANAHATGQSFVARLPTGPYMAIGVATVALSILLLWFLPQRSAATLLPSRGLGRIAATVQARTLCSMMMFLLLCGGIVSGLSGTRDPLENPLVLGFWVAFWMASPMVQGYLFDLWGWISPWRWATSQSSGWLGRRLRGGRGVAGSGSASGISLHLADRRSDPHALLS